MSATPHRSAAGGAAGSPGGRGAPLPLRCMYGRRFFPGRFDGCALKPWARRTGRLDLVVHHLGLALGGRPAASFARRLMLPVSNDTLLRVVRRLTARRTDPLTVVGVDA